MDGFACGEPRERLKPKEKVVMVVAALAAYKHDTLGHYLPTVLHFRLQATLFLQKFWVSNAIRLSLSTPKIIQPFILFHEIIKNRRIRK